MLDIPNERSSHVVPTPRGGGVAIVLTTTVALAILTLFGAVGVDLFIALCGGGVAVAAIGYCDDRYNLPARIRIVVHLASAVWALAWLGGLPPLQIGDEIVSLGWQGYLLGALGITWTLNLFNFMDGIDGIAASEAVFIASGGVLMALFAGTSLPAAALVFGAACCGFLVWNWPPAKIFLGDVGSGYAGYVIAVLAVAAGRENAVALLSWLILGGVFFVDATVTLVRRLIRRERVYEAHRSHAYQWLARRWNSHKRVTFIVLAVNVLWLLPCALLTTIYPNGAAWITLCTLTPVLIAAIIAGAGRRST